MVQVVIGSAVDQSLIASPFWDTTWRVDVVGGVGGYGDWVLTETTDDPTQEPSNRGGLSARDPIGTAIILCLFTDKRRPDWMTSPDGSGDPRGWHGDTFDIEKESGERELGSLLWTLERSPFISAHTKRMAEFYAMDALQTLVDQGLVSEFVVEAEQTTDPPDRLYIRVQAFLKSQVKPIFDQRLYLLPSSSE